MFNQEELIIGVNYLKSKNLINNFKNYQLTEQDIKNCRIYCIDEFYVFPDTEENIQKNIDIKWDLENLIKSGSCFGLSIYIYQLINYIQVIDLKNLSN